MATLYERAAAEAAGTSTASTGGPLTVANLLDDDKWGTVSAYMEDRTGMTERDYSREEIRDAFVNSMRGFNSGNSVDVVQEMNHLYQGQGEELDRRRATASEAYDLWDSLGGAFNENTTGAERLDAVGDYARSLILDPVNVVSLGFGKAGGAVATRGATAALRALASSAGRAAASAATARGATQQAITLAATQAQSRVMTRGFQELAATGGQAAVTSATRRRVVGDMLGSGLLDSAAAVAADAGIQQADRMTGRQDEYSAAQGAVSAVGGLLGAGLQGGFAMARGWGRTGTAGTNIQAGEEAFEAALKEVDEAAGAARRLAAVAADGDRDEIMQQAMRDWLTPFEDLVEAGRGVDAGDAGSEDFIGFYNGLRTFFNEAGIPVDSLNARLGQRRAGWYYDVIADENFPVEWRQRIEAAVEGNFRDSTGEILDLDGVMLKGAETASQAGRVLRSLSAAKRSSNRMGLDDVPDGDVVARAMRDPRGLDGPDATDKVKDWFVHSQNNFIRMLVTHPATTALNVVGWANASAMKSTSDMIKGTLYGGTSVLRNLVGDTAGAAKYRQLAGNAFSANMQKFRNLVNLTATRDEALDYLTHRPEAQRALFSYISGGIKTEDAVAKLNRILDDAPDPRTGMTKAMDFAQTAYGVTAQDMLTKTQEFMYSLDLRIRNEYGMSYNEFMQRPDIFTLLKDPQKGASYEAFMRVEAGAVEDALGNVFARRLGKLDGTMLERVANMIEEARNIPVIGALLPFGQFFNNSIAFMADHVGVSLLLKPYTRTNKTGLELLTKAAVGWGLIAFAVNNEEKNLEDGLAWHEERNSDGKVVSRIYDFPLSFWKIIGRMGAHMKRDGMVPKPLYEEFVATFSLPSVTRGLGDAAGGVQQLATEVFSGEAGWADVVPAVIASTSNLYLSGGSRFLDPINTALAFSEGEDYVPPSRNIGNKHLNNALRYTDRIFDGLIGLENIPVVGEDINRAYTTRNYTATSDRNIGANPGRISGSREVAPTSSVGRLFNEIGKPQWQTNMQFDNKEAQEVYERYIFPLLEYRADQVLENGRWDALDLAGKEQALRDIMSMARADVKASFAATPSGPRAEAGLIININNLKGSGRQAFDDMMEVFETSEESLGDLSLPQLQLLYDSIQSAQNVQGRREAAVFE